MTLTFLGQSGFVIDDGDWRVVIDPFLGPLENPQERSRFPRMFDSPLRPEDLRQVNMVLVSHHHGDHCHVETLTAIARQSPNCRFVVTHSSSEQLIGAGLAAERLFVPALPGWLSGSPVPVCVVPAAHYEFSSRADVTFDYFGFVIETSAGRVYSAGDTIPFRGQAELLRRLQTRIAVLPVNGRDAERDAAGIVGNMDVNEAVDLARRGGAEFVVACHIGMFEANTVDTGLITSAVLKHYAESSFWLPAAGDSRRF